MEITDAPDGLVDEVLGQIALRGYFTEPRSHLDHVVELVQLWGGTVLDVHHVDVDAGVSVGEDDAADLFAPREFLPHEAFPLVQWEDSKLWLCFSETMSGAVECGDDTFSFLQLIAHGSVETRLSKNGRWFRLPLEAGTRARVDIGSLTFFVHLVRPARRIAPDLLGRQDWAWLGMLGLTFLFLLAGGAAALLFGVLELARPGDDFARDTTREIYFQPAPTPKTARVKAPASGSGPKAPKPEGKAGRPDAKLNKAQGAPAKFSALALTQDMNIAAVFGDNALIEGLDKHLAGIEGPEGDQRGPGRGVRGPGSGGGGIGIRIGGFDERKRDGVGPGDDGENRWTKPDADIGIEDEVLVLAYPRELILRTVRGIHPQLKACYEKGLRSDNSLGGKVVVRFKFGRDGRVTSAVVKQSTLRGSSHKQVEACVIQRFSKLRFPPPEGGVVIVNYPLFLDTAGL